MRIIAASPNAGEATLIRRSPNGTGHHTRRQPGRGRPEFGTPGRNHRNQWSQSAGAAGERREQVAVGGHAEWLPAVIAKQPDLTPHLTAKRRRPLAHRDVDHHFHSSLTPHTLTTPHERLCESTLRKRGGANPTFECSPPVDNSSGLCSRRIPMLRQQTDINSTALLDR
jgi:hypothetical protein